MKKLVLTLAVAAFVFSPVLVSEAAGRGAQQLVSHSQAGDAGGVVKTGKAAKSPKHSSKKHKKHHKKHHKHHKHHKKN